LVYKKSQNHLFKTYQDDFMEIAYYPGCTLQASSSLYDKQCKKIFSEMEINLIEIEDWNCCGATSASKVNDFLATAMPARNIGIAEASGFTEIIIPCSACYSRTLVAQKQMENDIALKKEINSGLSHKVQGHLRISSILEVLLAKVESGELIAKVKKKLKGLSAACYYGCLLSRFPYHVTVPDNVENPQSMETIIKQLGVKPLDWNYKTDCCGASAAVNDEDTALNLMAKIMQDAVARDANCFVVTCPMCQFNMDVYQEKFCTKKGITKRLPVYFITELIGLAFGKGIEELQLDRHFVNSTKLLEELSLL
jgi:heterodisulfide reductase subunit B